MFIQPFCQCCTTSNPGKHCTAIHTIIRSTYVSAFAVIAVIPSCIFKTFYSLSEAVWDAIITWRNQSRECDCTGRWGEVNVAAGVHGQKKGDATLQVWTGMKEEAGDQKEIALIALSCTGQPSEPCLGVGRCSLWSSWSRKQGGVIMLQRNTERCVTTWLWFVKKEHSTGQIQNRFI